MHTLSYVTSAQPLLGPVHGTFRSETANEDCNWHVYMHCMDCMHEQKGASEAPRTHFRANKISKFPWGRAPQTPLTQSIKGVPLFVFALGPHNPLGGPGSILFPLLFVSAIKCAHACKTRDVAHIINFHCGICILECNIRIIFSYGVHCY